MPRSLTAPLVTSIVLEQTNATVGRWAVEHPITIALVTGLVLVALTVLGVERLLAHVESQRWLAPALEAINVWLFAADSAIRTIGKGIERAVNPLADAPVPGTDVGEFLQVLPEEDPGALRDLSDLVRTQAGELGITAMTAVSIVGRYSPLGHAVAVMFNDQRRFDEVAQTCWTMAWSSPLLVGEHREKALPLAVENAQRVGKLLNAINDDLAELRLYVIETRGASPRL